MSKMRAFQIPRRGGPLELKELPIPNATAGTVRIKVEACGICHSDVAIVQGFVPGQQYPRIPGHEVVGTIDAVGPGVTAWRVGQRVGVGWNGGYDGTCDACRRGDFFGCATGAIAGSTFDGGYAEYMVAPISALARVPSELSPTDGAPLMCAGVTTYNALRMSGARPGELVAVQGLGGLGHLAVQFAAKMGFRTAAIARGKDKEALARNLGAVHYIDSQAEDAAAALTKLGGAKIIVATVTSGKAMSAAIAGLGLNGKLLLVGVPGDPIEVPAIPMVFGRRSVEGIYSGTAIDSEDTLAFSVLTKVRSMNEVFPFSQTPQAYERMLSGDARFRVVLDMKR